MAELKTPFFNNINLDLVKTQAWVPQQVFATSGDTGYAQIFSLYENGSAYNNATTADLNFRALKADGNVVDITSGNGFKAMDNPNQFIFAIPAQTFATTGKVECYFYITNSDGSIVASTTHFYYQVLNSVPEHTDSISYIASLNDVVKHAKDLENQALGLISEITANKTATDKQSTDFAVDLKQKQLDAGKQVDQMLADTKKALDASVVAAGDYKQKLNDLNDHYLAKYNELLAKLPDADTEVQRQIGDAIAKLQDDEQAQFQKIQMDWVKQKETLNSSIADYQSGVEKQLDQLKDQISNISGENVANLAKQIDDLQTKLASMKLDEYYTKKEIDDKLSAYQPSIDLSGYETTKHAEDTYAKKTDIVAPDLSGYETIENANSTFAKKTDIPALPDMSNYAKKTDIPASPDLSSYETISHADSTYAKKSDISGFETKSDADATYAKKSDIPQGQDLSVYETKENAEQTYAKKADIPDMSGFATSADIAKTYETKEDASTHLTKTQADADYATKDDLANIKPNLTGYVKTTDLAGYAKKSDVSPIKTVHVLPNGWPSDAPGNEIKPDQNGNIKIDLSQYVYESELSKLLGGYYTCDESEERYAKKSDIPNLSTYLTKTDADADYLAKSDAANFATKDDVKNVAGVKSVSINDGSGSDINVPISRDGALDLNLSNYQQKPSTSYYITKDDADATYAKKSDSTGSGSIDLSDYLKKSDADSNYIKSFKVYYRNQGQTTYQSVTPGNTNLMLMNLLTKTDADADYVTKGDAANFATKDDLKKAGTSGGSVDLTGYLKKDDADKTYIKIGSTHAFSKFDLISEQISPTIENGTITSFKEAYTSCYPQFGGGRFSYDWNWVAFPSLVRVNTYGATSASENAMRKRSQEGYLRDYIIEVFDKLYINGLRLLTNSDLDSINSNTLAYAEKDTEQDAITASNSTNPTIAYCSATKAFYIKGHKLVASD